VTTTPIETLDDLLNRVCAHYCGECGEPLDPPGSQCAACGTLPRETRQEAAERLTGEPDLVDQVEAWRLRKEAMGMLAAAERLFREADAEEHRSVLRKARDAAEDQLDAASDRLPGAEEALEIAIAAEEMAAGPFADAHRVHQEAVKAAEEARRLRRGAQAEVEANVRLEQAAGVLARYRDEAHAATVGRKAAEEALQAVERDIAARAQDADRTQGALEHCKPVPLSAATVALLAAPLMRMSAGTDIGKTPLTAAERLMAGLYGQAAYSIATQEYAGALDGAEEARIRARLQEEARNQPHLRQVSDGMFAAAWANPPKPAAGKPANAVVTPPPAVRPDTGFQGSPGLYQQPVQQ
jgi:hypothetical protein